MPACLKLGGGAWIWLGNQADPRDVPHAHETTTERRVEAGRVLQHWRLAPLKGNQPAEVEQHP